MITQKKFKITDMHCTSCAISIDMDLENTEGIFESNTNYARGETEVKFDKDKVTDRQIVKIIKNVGYTAEPVVN